jgi:hypothetical protein
MPKAKSVVPPDDNPVLGVHTLRMTRPGVDRELEWFFNRAECDMGIRSNFLAVLEGRHSGGDGPTPEEAVTAAHSYRRIQTWLLAIPDSDAGVLQAAYEIRPWPSALYDELGRLTGVVVRLACALDPWPDDRKTQELVEMAKASWLEWECGRYRKYGFGPLARLRREGEKRFARAHHAYCAVRGEGPSLEGAS